MYIKNEIFYHLHKPEIKRDQWKVGNTLNFSNKQLNNFNSYYEHYSPKINIDNNSYEPLEGFEVAINNNIHNSTPDNANYFIKIAKDIIKEQSLYIREQIFEEIRNNYFPSLPSRKTCIWVCKKQSVKYWLQSLNSGEDLYKLELTGILHKADQRHLQVQVTSHEELKRNAFNYWTGADGENIIEEEYLFEGIVKVKEKYSDINEMQSKNP